MALVPVVHSSWASKAKVLYKVGMATDASDFNSSCLQFCLIEYLSLFSLEVNKSLQV